MKLFYCAACEDIVMLTFRERTCRCKRSSGAYVNRINAWVSGSAIPLGINNMDFQEAIMRRTQEGPGERFDAFVIPVNCDTVEERSISE